MEGYKPIYINYKGKQYQIPYCYDYTIFIQRIKKKLQLSNIECEKISFFFNFERNESKFSLTVQNSEDFNAANDIGQSYNKIFATIILPKSINNENNLDIIIKELKQEKKSLIKKFIQIRKKNIQLVKELYNKNNKNEDINEILGRFNIIEKSEKSFIKESNKKIEKKSLIPNNMKINTIQSTLYDCKFLDSHNQIIELKKNDINQNNPIYYYFKIQNIGKDEWPKDTFLKCENDDTEIFFYHSTLKDDCEMIYDKESTLYYFKFKINVIFKNYGNIHDGVEYKLRAYLVSDKFNRIGNNYGQLIVKVLPEDNDDELLYFNNNLLEEDEDYEKDD